MQNKPRITDTRRKQMVKEYEAGATLTMLSVKNKLGLPIVREILVEGGAVIRKKGGSQPFDANRAEDMIALYVNEEKTLAEIGEQFNVTRERVRQILRSSGVKSLGRREKRQEDVVLTDQEKEIAAAYDAGTRPADLMAQYDDLTYVTLQAILKKANVATKPKGFFNRRDGYQKTVRGIVADYKKGDDTGKIVDRYGLCAPTEIYKFLKREGVPVRLHHDDAESAS